MMSGKNRQQWSLIDVIMTAALFTFFVCGVYIWCSLDLQKMRDDFDAWYELRVSQAVNMDAGIAGDGGSDGGS